MRIAIVADHNGVALKGQLIETFSGRGHRFDDRGVDSAETVDYPPLCYDACRQVLAGAADRAVVIGGSGSGETMACNKLAGIRAVLGNDLFVAEISRANNDANVLVLGAKVIAPALAEKILELWLSTDFKGGVHQRRLDQITAIERGETPKA